MNTEDNAEEASQPHPRRGVKRGAFPTPQSEIDKAPVFVPPGAEDDDRPRQESEQSPADSDDDESR